MSQYLDNVYKFILFIVLVAMAYDPTSVGEWKAQMDIGYDLIWSEYLMDYTCDEEN